MIAKLVRPQTIEDLLKRLGDVPPCRVRLQPAPGKATEKDVLSIHGREKRRFELVQGVLVEKVMGFYESRAALVLGYLLEGFQQRHDLGIVAGESGMLRLGTGLVRIPDVSFVSWDKLPGRKLPREPIPALVPDLAVEILSRGNTKAEMQLKLKEYFAAGVRLVWYINPRTRTVTVYDRIGNPVVLSERDTLKGGDVLPGFKLPLKKYFARVELK